MNRIAETFNRLSDANQKALVAYVMAGYPDAERTMSAVRGLVAGGADIIELGFPFSDPLADGPVIQEAATISLGQGTTLESYYDMVQDIRRFSSDIPLIIMTYTNVAYSVGYDAFAHQISDAGMDGIILPDMPVEESESYQKYAHAEGLDTIFLASPNTSDARVSRIAEASTGFLYMVAVYGTTGAGGGVRRYAIDALRRIKAVSEKLPVGVGFGVNGHDDVRQYVKAGADAVIVGSSILRIIKESPRNDIESRVARFVRSLKDGTISFQ